MHPTVTTTSKHISITHSVAQLDEIKTPVSLEKMYIIGQWKLTADHNISHCQVYHQNMNIYSRF